MFGRGNSFSDLRNFFSIPGRLVSEAEFTDFWLSCTDALKDYFKTVKLA